MMSEQDAHDQEIPEGADAVLRRLTEIDRSLLEQLEHDDRLQSGVPAPRRGTDLDFIRMTGLPRPGPDAAPASATVVLPEETDGRQPLSFFEKGVADVDAGMELPSLEELHVDDDNLLLRIEKRPAPAPEEEVAPAGLPADRIEFPTRRAVEAAPGVEKELQAPADNRAPEAVREAAATEEPLEALEARGLSGAGWGLSQAPISGQVEVADVPSRAAPAEATPRGLRTLRAPDLTEAEQLLQALEHQPRDRVAVEDEDGLRRPRPVVESPAPCVVETPQEDKARASREWDEPVYRQPAELRPRRRSSRARSWSWRRAVRWVCGRWR
jgi:hypothetical protein